MKIVGDGKFGTFLKEFFDETTASGRKYHPELFQDIDFESLVILAVPFSAYEEVAKENEGKHLVNVCSVQEETNKICLKYSDRVTGIHPMFGPRSPEDSRVCILTHISEDASAADLFLKSGCGVIAKTPGGDRITGKWHDKLMANTHAKAISIANFIKPLVKESWDIDDVYLPASVQKLKEVLWQLGDMSPGTLESIKANKYIDL